MRDWASDAGRTPRQHWLSVLARASAPELEAVLAQHGGIPAHTVIKPAEVGTVMIEGRAGGAGVRFNLGEAAATRCVVRFDDGTLGVAYALGSGRRKAHLAALVDGMLQTAEESHSLQAAIESLAAGQAAQRELASRKAASTKVDFFTLVRGSD